MTTTTTTPAIDLSIYSYRLGAVATVCDRLDAERALIALAM